MIKIQPHDLAVDEPQDQLPIPLDVSVYDSVERDSSEVSSAELPSGKLDLPFREMRSGQKEHGIPVGEWRRESNAGCHCRGFHTST